MGGDNDCNGLIDESDPNLGKPCYRQGLSDAACRPETCTGQCRLGGWVCHGRDSGSVRAR